MHGEGRESVGRNTNIIADQHYFADLVPLEHSLARGNVDTLACVGDQDAYVVRPFSIIFPSYVNVPTVNWPLK